MYQQQLHYPPQWQQQQPADTQQPPPPPPPPPPPLPPPPPGKPQRGAGARRSSDQGLSRLTAPLPSPPHGAVAAQRDRRPTHERYSYAPSLGERTQRLADRYAGGRPVVERLYNEDEVGTRSISNKGAAAKRTVEALDLHSFDYAVEAGLEMDGHRGQRAGVRAEPHRPSTSASKSKTYEDRVLASGEYTFAPRTGAAAAGSGNSPAAAAGGGGSPAPVCGEPGLPASARSRRSEANGPAWARLFAMGNEKRAAEKRAEAQAAASQEQPDPQYSYKPQISSRAQQLRRSGFVEDRLLSGWAEKLVAFEERITAEKLAEQQEQALYYDLPGGGGGGGGVMGGMGGAGGGRGAARAAGGGKGLGVGTSSSSSTQQSEAAAGQAVRRLVEERRQAEAKPLHERLYGEHQSRIAKLEERRQKEGTEPLQRWDGSLLSPGELRITKRASELVVPAYASVHASAGAPHAPDHAEAAAGGGSTVVRTIYSSPRGEGGGLEGTPSSAPMATGGEGGEGGGEVSSSSSSSAFERLHRTGSALLRGRLEEHQSWQSIANERLSGRTGSAPRPSAAVAVEAERCSLLYQRAQEQQRRHKEREQQQAAAAAQALPGRSPAAAAAAAGRSPAAPGGSGGCGSGTSPAAAAVSRASSVVMSRAELEARAAQRHFEAMVRLQQKEELALQAQREAEAQATERISRTAPSGGSGGGGVGGHGGKAFAKAGEQASERLYQRAIEQQARLERQTVERRLQQAEEELAGSTFSPSLAATAARRASVGDERPVEARVMEWHEAKLERQAMRQLEVVETSGQAPPRLGGGTAPGSAGAAGKHFKATAATPLAGHPLRRSGNPQFSGGRPKTVEQL